MTKITSLKMISKDDLEKIIKESDSLKESLLFLGFSSSSGTMFKILKERINYFSIDISHFYNKNSKVYTLEDIFVENSPYLKRDGLKRKILQYKLLEYKCSRCGNLGEWEGEKLVLQLEHKNGISNDHRLENLTFLCPNCHSLTHTFSGRNNYKKNSEEIKKQKELYLENKSKLSEYENIKKNIDLDELKKEIDTFGLEETAKKYKRNKYTINKWLGIKKYKRKNYFKKNENHPLKSFNLEDILITIKTYGYFFAVKKFNLSRRQILTYLKKNNISQIILNMKDINSNLLNVNQDIKNIGKELTANKYNLSLDDLNIITELVKSKITFTPEEIYLFVKLNGYTKASKKYGFSDTALKKFLIKHNLNPLKDNKENNFSIKILELSKYIKTKNRLPSETKDKDLYNFIANMREKKKINSLKLEEIEILNEISPLILNPLSKESQWEEKFHLLEEFISKQKRSPRRTEKDKNEMKLAEWIRTTIRTNNPEKIKKIKDLFLKYEVK